MPATRLILIAFVAVLAALGAAQSKSPKPDPARPVLTDAELERAIRGRFAKSKIAVNQFTVRVQGGVATIEGRTDVIQHKGTATRLAKMAGAKQVVNRVVVSEKAKERASANLAKGRRRVQVKRSETTPRSRPNVR